MRILKFIVCAAVFAATRALAYEGPSPLKDIKIEVEVAKVPPDIFKYNYTITNPAKNDGEVVSFDLFIRQNKQKDAQLSEEGISQCRSYLGMPREFIEEKYLFLPIGSQAPDGWSCSQGRPRDEGAPSYGFFVSAHLTPGKSQGGLVMISRGLPAIRDAKVSADIDLDRLPDEYYENVEKTVALENKVNWRGRSLGPKAPPKIFNAEEVVSELKKSLDESEKLGWVLSSTLARQLESKLMKAVNKLAIGDKKSAQDLLADLRDQIEAQKGKQLTSEGHALLYYNLEYILKQLATALPNKAK